MGRKRKLSKMLGKLLPKERKRMGPKYKQGGRS